MDYIYENLGDERFQELCSAIISSEYSDVQIFPVGQPDGGRDTIVYIMNSLQKEQLIFQVKYVRNPSMIQDKVKWLSDIIKTESPKIEKLTKRGAQKYYLMTNIKGSAHLDSGSIDKINAVLEEYIPIPAVCWWRDDISRKLEAFPFVKWSFLEILNGQDILSHILLKSTNDDNKNIEEIIKAYLADQYIVDNEVKFKQIDLQCNLLDLYTDVPIRIKQFNDKNKSIRRLLYSHLGRKQFALFDENHQEFRESDIGAATFFLQPHNLQYILLEGGPGQGKSTISQYICQIHRARLLNKPEVRIVPEVHKNTPVRLPFKIDLRQVAMWLKSENPYESRLSDDYFHSIWKNSLESFLVGHIVYHSQLDCFDSNSLIEILKKSSILLVFDGFDEIADFKIREKVIEFINKGVNRIYEYTKSIQVIVTSRPAAFSDSVGFSTEIYTHFELTDINTDTINNYVSKWIKAKKLDNRESAELKHLIDEKLKMPHLRDLARSPMQLAILISLVRTRGESLPNKRTSLYDSYIDLFFNREAEKNIIIRDSRDLIIDIHQYIAWVLHSEAEQYGRSGSIHIDRLKKILKEYLEKEGHDAGIADDLFDVMKERVCALVSRIQGTFEFEVQPLREYFCARYLYNTSPYSPIGNEKRGTKPERFGAAARSFYWNNVVRFFAGCLDKGELPMLIHELKLLQNDDTLRYTHYPRLLTSQILSDWVFTQYPLLLKDAVSIIIDGINIGNIINQNERGLDSIFLPKECGRPEIIKECFKQLKLFPKVDYAIELIGLIRNNPLEVEDNWFDELHNLSKKELTQWLEYAYHLGIIHKINVSAIESIILKDSLDLDKRLEIVLKGNRFDLLDNNLSLKEEALNGFLEYNIDINPRDINHTFKIISALFHPMFLFAPILEENKYYHNDISVTMRELFLRRFERAKNTYKNNLDNNEHLIFDNIEVKDSVDKLIIDYFNKISKVLDNSLYEWRTSLEPWDIVIENARESFSDKWRILTLSVIAAGIKSRDETYSTFDSLDNKALSLCKRVRCARMKSGNLTYWHTQLKKTSNITFTLLVLITWCTPKVIIALLQSLSDLTQKISKHDFALLSKSLKQTCQINPTILLRSKELFSILIKNSDISSELIHLLSFRLSSEDRRVLIRKKMFEIKSKDDILAEKLSSLVDLYLLNPEDESLLEEIKNTYSYIPYNMGYRNIYMIFKQQQSILIDIQTAKKIMEDSKKYPRVISVLAEKSCRLYANENMTPVGETASKDNWFES